MSNYSKKECLISNNVDGGVAICASKYILKRVNL